MASARFWFRWLNCKKEPHWVSFLQKTQMWIYQEWVLVLSFEMIITSKEYKLCNIDTSYIHKYLRKNNSYHFVYNSNKRGKKTNNIWEIKYLEWIKDHLCTPTPAIQWKAWIMSKTTKGQNKEVTCMYDRYWVCANSSHLFSQVIPFYFLSILSKYTVIMI